MPESRTYLVTRTQRVKVTANTMADAEHLAIAALEGADTQAANMPWGRVDGPVTMRGAFTEGATVGIHTERTA